VRWVNSLILSDFHFNDMRTIPLILLALLCGSVIAKDVTFDKYPSCDKDRKGVTIDKQRPYRKCHLDLVMDVSGHKFLKDDDTPRVAYNVNIEVFPSEDGLSGTGEIIWPSGVRYFGQIKSGLPFGKGKVFFPKEWPVDSYTGEFSNTASKVYSTEKYQSGYFDSLFPGLINDIRIEKTDGSYDQISLFLMEFSPILMSGKGELIYRDGKKVIGVFENGIHLEK